MKRLAKYALALSLATAAISGTSAVSAKETFIDLAQATWAKDAVYYLNERGIINGYGNGYFGATDNITRGQAAVMLVRELYPNETSTTKLAFPDVDPNSYYYNAIAVAVDHGIFTGNPDGTFAPDDPISRAATAKILAVAYNLTGTQGNFKDLQQAPWAKEYVNALASNHISTGYTDYTFKPNNAISRAEFSVLFARVLNESFRQAPDFTNPDYYYEYIISEIAANAAKQGTTAGKVAAVYEALGKHIEYEDRGLNYPVAHTGRGAIVDGRAYCDGYAEAMIAVLERLNIHAVEVISWPMDHSWVMVNVDGQYYHVDLTWGDAWEREQANYQYFLLSDAEMQKYGYSGWRTDLTATSTKYSVIQSILMSLEIMGYSNDALYYAEVLDSSSFYTVKQVKRISLADASITPDPNLQFNHIVSAGEWHYGVNNNQEQQQFELYRFNLKGDQQLLDSGKGTIMNPPVTKQPGVLKYSVSDHETFTSEERQLSIQ